MRDLNADGRLALFIGAGISMGCGLPSWKELVERVVHEAWKNDPEFCKALLNDPRILAPRYARAKLGERFNQIIHECLYRDNYTISACVKAIAKSGLRRVCTFNFDDLLEDALLSEGIDAVIASPDEAFSASASDAVVYHPHGVLPLFSNKDELDGVQIVFSEDDYHNLYSDPYSWANVAQLSLLTGYSVLFVGLSMQDPNLRRLIDVARSRGFKNQHFAVFLDPIKGGAKGQAIERAHIRKVLELDLKSLGVTPWFIDGHEKLDEIFHHIRVRP
jgi:hypothetical protein